MTLCSEAVLVNTSTLAHRAITLRCRSWNCDHCAPLRQSELIAKIADGKPQRLLTLTVRRGTKDTPEAQARFMALSFRRLMRLIRKAHPKVDHQYFVVFEAHKSGWPHMHVALRGEYVHWEWLADTWQALTGSRNVDIRKVWRPSKCAAYVAKYMGKDTEKFGTCKRYWCSGSWDLSPLEEREDHRDWSEHWVKEDTTLAKVAHCWYARYRSLWWEGKHLCTGHDPPEWAVHVDPQDV